MKIKHFFIHALLIIVLLGLLLTIVYLLYPAPAPNSLSTLSNYNQLRWPRLNLNINQPLTLKDVPTISAWMTFDYLNKVFVLPPTYLAATLKITDRQYPNLTINHYARQNKLNVLNLVPQVRTAVANYLQSH